MALMALPELSMILYTREFELEAGDGTQGSEEIRPQGVS
jgi:hypothetical protein